MLVVSDTSPITSLCQIGRSNLLFDIFGRVVIPPSVYDELARFHTSVPAFVEVHAVLDQARVTMLCSTLDVGEAEAIVLAAEIDADYLLIDERRGRKVAAEHDVPTIGLLGLLQLAKNRMLVASLKECIEELQAKAGFYVSEDLKQRVIAAAGE